MTWKLAGNVIESVRVGSAVAKSVLTVLANYAREEDGRAWPSIKTICENSEFKDRAVRDALAFLEREGWITRKKILGSSDMIWLNLDRIKFESEAQNSIRNGEVGPARDAGVDRDWSESGPARDAGGPARDAGVDRDWSESGPARDAGGSGIKRRGVRRETPGGPARDAYNTVIETDSETDRETASAAREPEVTTGVLVVIDQPQENFELVAQPDAPEKKSRRKREPSVATKLPENWKPTRKPSDRILNLISQWPDGMVEREFYKFLAKSEANCWKYVDWDAAFHNWLLKADEFLLERKRREPRSKSSIIDDWAANFGGRNGANGGGTSDVLPLDRDQGGELALAGPDDAWRRKGIWEKTHEDWVAEAKYHKYHFPGIRAGDEAVVRSYQKRYYPNVRFE